MTAWRVFHQKGLVDTYAQAQEAGAVKLIPSMFSQGDCAALGLGRCMRFLPHHADTGGFFVAVLEKVAECQSVSFPEPWQALRKRKREEMWRERAKEGGEAGEEGEGEGERAEAEEEKPAKKSAGGDGVAGACAVEHRWRWAPRGRERSAGGGGGVGR